MSTPHGTGNHSGEAARRHLQASAHRHMWLHFTRMSSYAEGNMPVIVRGSGQYVYDDRGKRYLDGLSGLFVSQVGHGRAELAEAGARQASELAYFPLWSYAHPRAIELAERLAALAPGQLNRVFFTTSGSEAISRLITLYRPGWPILLKYCLASFQADSTASEPLVVKKTRFSWPGARAASRSASSIARGCAYDQSGK